MVFVGVFLELVEEFLRIGLLVLEVIEGYEIVCRKVYEIFFNLVCCFVKNFWDIDEVLFLFCIFIMSK